MKKISNWAKGAAASGILFLANVQGAYAQIEKIDNITTQLKSGSLKVINVISVMIGLIAVIMLAWNYYKRSKGDGQSNDALAAWGWGLLIAIIGLQVVKVVFLQS